VQYSESWIFSSNFQSIFINSLINEYQKTGNAGLILFLEDVGKYFLLLNTLFVRNLPNLFFCFCHFLLRLCWLTLQLFRRQFEIHKIILYSLAWVAAAKQTEHGRKFWLLQAVGWAGSSPSSPSEISVGSMGQEQDEELDRQREILAARREKNIQMSILFPYMQIFCFQEASIFTPDLFSGGRLRDGKGKTKNCGGVRS
jgi:hypothetical protein